MSWHHNIAMLSSAHMARPPHEAPQSNVPITLRPCPECGTEMQLARIERDPPAHEVRIFQCPKCENSVKTLVKLGDRQ